MLNFFYDLLGREDWTNKVKRNNLTMNFTSAVSVNSTPRFNVLLTNVTYVVYSINLVFGLPTHSYIIWLIVTGTESGFASGFFSLNLSVCEIGICLNSLFSVLSHFLWLSSLKTLLYFLLGFAVTGRPLFQCLICVERYLAVVHAVTFLKSKPLRYRLICCAAVWIFTFGSCLCCIFTLVLLNIQVYAYICSIQYLLFFSIQLFCLVAVLRALKQSGPGDQRREEENHIKRRAFYLILITTVSMAVIYMPFMLTTFLYLLTYNFDEPFSLGVCFFILGGFVQPVLYLHGAGKLLSLFPIKNVICETLQS